MSRPRPQGSSRRSASASPPFPSATGPAAPPTSSRRRSTAPRNACRSRGLSPRALSRFLLHTLQTAKWVERANGNQFKAHHMGFAERQLFEHFVSDRRIGDVEDEHYARLAL